jgi:two-component system sensor histidine kinase NreB
MTSLAGLSAQTIRSVQLAPPPLRRRAFWAVQGLVFLIAAVHTFLETIADVTFPGELYLIPTSLFFIPVVYAALRFGVRGSVPTAVWSIVLTAPNVILLHDGLSRLGIIWQQMILLVVAVVVGLRVDHERLAQAEARTRDEARRISDARYRTLFDQAAEAVLVLGADGRVEDANTAASRLLGHPPHEIVGVEIAALAGDEIAAEIARSTRTARPFALGVGSQKQPTWVEVLASPPQSDANGRSHLQVILHDVTLQTERQQTLERYARRTVRTREEERRRIGRELHDGPLQSLMLLLRGLEAVERRPKSDTTPDPIVDARDLAEQTADELRRISRALRPSILDDLGLVPAIRSEAAALARRTNLKVDFAVTGAQGAIEPEVELVLLRVTQEALHNVERHSSASAATVRLRFGRTRTCLVIRDDGRGLDQSESASALLTSGKLGLVGMEERTRLVGGEFAARRRPVGGTIIVATVPSTAGTNDGPRPTADAALT